MIVTTVSTWLSLAYALLVAVFGTMALVPSPRRCTAMSRSGERCKKPPILGGTVCCSHGGAAGHVRRKAEQTLLAARDSAAAFLARLIDEAERNTCRACGRLWAHEKSVLALRAAVEVLNRTGMKDIGQKDQRRGLKGRTEEELIAMLEANLSMVKNEIEQRQPAPQPVVEAELVEAGR